MKLIEAARSALLNNMRLKTEEILLVITDEAKKEIGEAFFEAGKKLTSKIKMVIIPIPEINGTEPPISIVSDMKAADVIVAPLAKSISWTKARKQATDSGTRLASMARITEEIMLRSFPLDYEPIKDRVSKLSDQLDNGKKVLITTRLGTHISFSIDGRMAYGRNGGIYDEPGDWGNLPAGESFIAPVEGTARGNYIVDASQTGVGLIDNPIELIVKDGLVNKISGGDQAVKFHEMLDSINDPKAFTICELGIGANHKAIVSGVVLEDEKVLGTCHIALGNNILFGGNTDVEIHVDGVMKKPTIWIDNKKIMNEGDLTI